VQLGARASSDSTFGVAATGSRSEAVVSAKSLQALAIKVIFNYGIPSSEAATNETQKEFDVLTRLPTHPNIVRLLFECICRPPLWMVERIPDPSLVCLADGFNDDEGETGPGPLVPRKAHLTGVELLGMPLCDRMKQLRGSVGNTVLISWSLGMAEALLHLLHHGVVHRDLKLDTVMWDRTGGPEGIGRLVLIDFGCSLRVDVDPHIA